MVNPVAEASLTLVGVAAKEANESPRAANTIVRSGSSVFGDSEATPSSKGMKPGSSEAGALKRSPSTKSLVELEEVQAAEPKIDPSESGIAGSDAEGEEGRHRWGWERERGRGVEIMNPRSRRSASPVFESSSEDPEKA